VTSRRAVPQSIVEQEHPSHRKVQIPRDNLLRAMQSPLIMPAASLPGGQYENASKVSSWPLVRVRGQFILSIASCCCHAGGPGQSRVASEIWLVSGLWFAD
jgi:hypothetical protein